MVVDRLEHLLGCNQQRSHFPNGHLKVHLRELEQSNQSISLCTSSISPGVYNSPLEETRHPDTRPPSGWRRAKRRRTRMLTGQRNMRVHNDPRAVIIHGPREFLRLVLSVSFFLSSSLRCWLLGRCPDYVSIPGEHGAAPFRFRQPANISRRKEPEEEETRSRDEDILFMASS